jgi:hypothetical protein
MNDSGNKPGSRVVILFGQDGGTSRVCFQLGGEVKEMPLGIEPAALFRRDPPLEADLERAIDVVEEAVMPLAHLMPESPMLVAGDDVARSLVRLSLGEGVAADQCATLEAIEALFEQLALAARRGVWPGDLRRDPLLSASLVILREFMHHSGLRHVATRATGSRPT